MLDGFGVSEDSWRDALEKHPGFAISESPTYVARGVTDVDGSKPDCWGYIAAHGIKEQSGEGIDAFR
jgi:hypothetical protein